ncbi:MAG: coproporphyrinogen III oxidase family protein, partial [Megasphaera micronuciformis]|nr:coproporphyrinogen III oxidase family protein [Megasphaera micronuciformis]
MTGLYVHIPFCVRKCLYCDFPSYGGILSYLDDYVEALCREIRATSYTGEAANTVYFGGGTPSLLTARQGEKIMSALTDTFRVDAGSEITFEINPDGIKSDYIHDLVQIGVNRISMGIQSFDDRLLRLLRRVHTSAEAFAALEAVRTGGVTNVSADLIYGLPGQSPEEAETDARTLIGLGVTHASAYSLIVEEGTMLNRLVRKGEIILPEEGVTEEAGER